ncbi:LOW QUALITY PROTEIN: probable E3 ubiquitin-protein ligase RHC2A [Arabidopsis lyrata subsp. lyrata]|uniref:LOW QUALITY PROTEIN: probable E3 ubiquitin-protein ligase RHC2A n=1 Tax=Arabidopsis lyrata subsp. lyrata TaxID=81972 RepID=UPI000A29E6DD|nr:LOW QUALITY PROTEIN: probable E3 ubiquitin-protein ligase RHC2A [Arabidopsis lyrata subsp. lyrata]|eukprot:XP_020885345.1 LOW QUALITY PROTEIN: probable E3 ubiquitin-protein ligase RHC2A [Arabidopsis lyrata subsp. lyrata]
MSSSSTQYQLEMRNYTCPECNIMLRVLSSPSASPPYCPLCNIVSSFTYSTPFEVGPSDFEDDEESLFLDSMESLPTVEISSSMLSCASSDDSNLPCAICREDFVVGESARKLPCNHLYHNDCIIPWLTSHNSCPLCRFELPVAFSGDDSGLTMWFDALTLEDDCVLREDTVVTLALYQSLDG